MCVSLKAQEETEKSKWSTRLQRIATRAGAAAKINGPAREGLSAREDEAIKSIVFKSGAFRTMRQNIRAWEKFDEWANPGRGQHLSPDRCSGRQVLPVHGQIELWTFGDPGVLLRDGLGMQKARHGISCSDVP